MYILVLKCKNVKREEMAAKFDKINLTVNRSLGPN